ncbi:MAG TPA: hypothetical protein VJS12_04620 [Steroidobacteraceae bacterium]|nr:hypothetical protein [Steroidobacteraceae bacterium]
MSKLNVSMLEGRPLLDLRSYGRRGPGHRDRLSPAEIAQISRTVRGVPEAVVKVLPRDSNNLASINRHVGYIGRYGDLELEVDDGERLSGKGIGRQLLEDWDLDLDQHRRQTNLAAALGRKPPKLVHKLMFSMPPGTPAQGVLAAVRNFLREEFALSHRYAFVLHTDEPHPHVHALVKAVSEQGVRLNIRKATLREWRREFARHLREQGIEANATERAVRGACRIQKLDGIFRATRRGVSTHSRERAEIVAAELQRGELRTERGKQELTQTRKHVELGWSAVRDMLISDGLPELASEVRHFSRQMPPARTEKEQIAALLRGLIREAQVQQRPRTR